MKILAFDTALSGISIALCNDDIIMTRQIETAREQASLLIPMIQEVLEAGKLDFKDIDALACTIGPGSFTGLRIGMTTAKILALALKKPVLGINTLALMAHHYDIQTPLLIVLETKRQDFYACYYDKNYNAVITPFAASAEEILAQAPKEDFVIGGDCLERFKSASNINPKLFLENISQPNPEKLLEIAKLNYKNQSNAEPLKPLYLRGADTSQPKNKPRVLEKTS